MRRLNQTFFNRPTIRVAEDLIGCYLVRRRKSRHGDSKIERLMITETEAYDGLKDKASHASRGKTKRNEIMFRSAGHIYVYFTYGMHWMLNIVTGSKDHPAAILIRGARDFKSGKILSGPARLTKHLNITGTLNGKKLGRASGLWVEAPDKKTPARLIKKMSRIGVDYAGSVWAKKKWRFTLEQRSGESML
jgi:DNA-3-methyladenine glycosylase